MQISTTTIRKNFQQYGPSIARSSLYLLAIFLFCVSYWIHRYFGRPDLNQIAYHLNFGIELTNSSDPVFLRRFVRWCVLAPLIFLAILSFYFEPRMLTAISRTPSRFRTPLSRIHRVLPQLLILGAAVFWTYDVSALKYASANFGPDYFGANYIPPGSVMLVEKKPKNLILIYVESLEMGYANGSEFGRDLLAPLTDLQGTTFPDYEQAPGTGWTIAAIVATQCAVPLERVTIFDANTQGQMVDSFLKKAVCLSDVLADHGYRNVFMGGASPSFAGKGRFLNQHHYHEVYGKEDWLLGGVSESDMNGWGLYDGDLFQRAKAKLRTLSASHQKFNLTLLTVDTHEPEGHLSKSCARSGFAEFGGVVSCTAREVAEFVRFARDNGYMETTNIVIVGDHLSRENPLSAQLTQLPNRTIFNTFLSNEPPAPNRTQLLHFDLMPTILEFSGFAIPDGRLGLGYSAFNQHPSHPPKERMHEMEKDLLNRSYEYMALWAEQAH
ncbi:MAG: sulfatase-like hydrolase/transferase [Pseudomonadota bacterium]